MNLEYLIQICGDNDQPGPCYQFLHRQLQKLKGGPDLPHNKNCTSSSVLRPESKWHITYYYFSPKPFHKYTLNLPEIITGNVNNRKEREM